MVTAHFLDHDERSDAPIPMALIGLDAITLRYEPPRDPSCPTFAIHTLGCKLNTADAQAISFALVEQGFAEVPFDAPADLYIVNTCTVTHIADKKGRQYLRKARQTGGADAMVAAVGCYTAVAPEDAEAMPEVDLVLGSVDKERVVAEAVERFADRLAAVGLADTHLRTHAAHRTRRTIKIQEGCDARCTFCIVPRARGRSVSVAAERVCHEVAESAALGYQEVVLTGTYVGMYREDRRQSAVNSRAVSVLKLPDLLHAILAGPTPPRIRLTSVGPAELKPDLLACWADRRMARHLHMPIQSGSARVLRAMRRRYNPDQFRHAVARVRATIPDCAITTDVIVGFPGETEDEFRETLALCRELAFSKIHAFPYSERAGTEAAGMTDQIPPEVKKERMAQLLALSNELAHAYHRQFVGQTLDVLWEDHESDGRWSGLTDNYLRVLATTDDNLHNRVLPTRLVHAESAYLDGAVVAEVQ
ncbi:MAG: tRNA (N(6)-L-threonylcarbamoyladenosine(37)-C(2))-methylthiotransferase MtaB [Thermomicrobia bacterium]|nr:tRNA (N(6)-L-threonylcarbamoyladenosine(37)-C(2))-methylthiotransferase MtaB [Thermomicrobia bacterium]